MNERTTQSHDQSPAKSRKPLHRRTVLKLFTALGTLSALGGSETGCATPTPKPEIVPQTDTEKQIDHTIKVFKTLLPHPYESWNSDFAVLTRGTLENNDQAQEVTDLAQAVGKQFTGEKGQKLFIYPQETQMMAVASFILENGSKDPDELIKLHEDTKKRMDTSDGELATMIAIMAMAGDQDFISAANTYKAAVTNILEEKQGDNAIFYRTENSATKGILTALLKRYPNIEDIKTWYKTFLTDTTHKYGPETAANLTLATFFAKGDVKKVQEVYKKVKEVFKTSYSEETENYQTAFTLACILNDQDFDKTLEMYSYAKKHDYSSQVSCILVLDTIAHEKKIPLVLTVTSELTKDQKSDRKLIVPLLLTPTI